MQAFGGMAFNFDSNLTVIQAGVAGGHADLASFALHLLFGAGYLF